jgi:uncharacterized protein (UPF0335 family)
MQVVRNFVKRATEKSSWDGDIGRVMLETDATVIKLNGKPIPAQSMEYLLTFALQSLQDAYAGAQSLDEAKGNWEKKLAAITEGTLGQRSGGGSVSEETKVARQITKQALKAKIAKGEMTEEEWKDLSDERLDEVFGKNEAKLRPLVDARIAELKKERERKAKLAQSASDLDL